MAGDKDDEGEGMDISEQERTFAGFTALIARGIAVIVVILLVLALFTI